jgi:ABC-type Fe3+-hydroxamate transport system substrate-binding protein
MQAYTDQLNNTILLDGSAPLRIVSLVPSQTELLHTLGLEEEVVGITKFCVHPRGWFAAKKRVGGTKAVHIDVVKALQPNLIIANKEENVKEQVEVLRAAAPVWVSDINNLQDALEMIEQVGLMVNKKPEALALAGQIETGFKWLAEALPPQAAQLLSQTAYRPPVAYLIWREPYMTVGGDTFIGDMIRRCGFANVFEEEKRYPQISLDELAHRNCRYIFLSSEPYPFKEQHAAEIRQQLPGAKVVFVNGEMFSWYGSRLLLAAQYFMELKDGLNHDPAFGGTGFGGFRGLA